MSQICPLRGCTRTAVGQAAPAFSVVRSHRSAHLNLPGCRLDGVQFDLRSRSVVDFQRTFWAGPRGSERKQLLRLRNLDVTGQDGAFIVKLKDAGRLRPAARVTLAFGSMDDDAHGAVSIVCAASRGGFAQDQSRIRFSIPNKWPPWAMGAVLSLIRKAGMRDSHSSRPMTISRRARCEPRQRWGP